ncbi:cAMP specific phosphodiesterase, partial [Trypanosoma theileri]
MFTQQRPVTNRNDVLHESNHLCEAFAIGESILGRYQRNKKTLSPSEKKAFASLLMKAPQELLSEIVASIESVAAPTSKQQQEFLPIMERTLIMGKPMKNIFQCLNEELGHVLESSRCRVYYLDPNDALLIDPVYGTAAALDESTPLGKTVSTGVECTIAGTLYIPLSLEGTVVGCVESSWGSTNYHNNPHAEAMIQLAASAVHNAI